ncbi:alpha/beta hydrolase-fold protein [Terriglobus roseus]|uniref:Enterochelin esterase n=1 Tax=Terriglobus roseus TaxID=392734 RepID=A0A1H4KDH2_9BACT|nr:alpha/beta hydrolase-fold protein [Terriglobus roseus]SEB56604.1 enterochelin esterase [Terriglobus roseus]
MNRLFSVATVLSLAFVNSANRLHGQAPATPSAAQGQVAATPVVSPEVHPDGTVTLRYEAAGAKAVTVTIEGNPKPIALTQNASGVWETTTTPMTPEFYGYTFAVDGKRALDPHNATVRPNLLSPTTVVHVSAASPKPWDRTDIPHGEVAHILYRSKLAKIDDGDTGDRDMWIYTPPGYDAKRKDKYPVLYLNHGYSDAANGWVEAGQANLILDSLLHDGKIVPMVVVMPLGYGTMHIVTAGWNRVGNLLFENQQAFSDQLLHEIIPMAEARFNIARDRDHRAIAGLSMGGGHSIYTGLNHPETFAYVGAFSSAISAPTLPATRPGVTIDAATYAAGFATIVPNAKTQQPLKLFWQSCGTEDGLITVNRAFGLWAKDNLKAKDIKTRDTPGMHTWMVWRDDLIDFTPLLFR